MKQIAIGTAFAALLLLPLTVVAGKADILQVEAFRSGDGTWRFSVTVSHADEGWDHYADAWDVVGSDGAVLATRVLAHPHETEQPFTRSLSGVFIPKDVDEVTIRARDSVHGYGGTEITVELSR